MAIRPTVPPRPSTGPRPGGGPGSGGGNLRPGTQNRPAPAKNRPGAYGPTSPAPPPTTPFQPGAPPSPPLGLISAGVGSLLLLGLELYRWLNQKGPKEQLPPVWGENTGLAFTPTPGLVFVRVRWGYRATYPTYDGPGSEAVENTFEGLAYGVLATGMQSRSLSGSNPPGANVSGRFGQIHFTNLDGSIGYTHPLFAFNGNIGLLPGLSGTVTVSPYANFEVRDTGQPLPPPFPPVEGEGVPLPDQVRPVLPASLPEGDPQPVPAPLPVLPVPVAPPVPAVAPAFPRPATSPGGAPAVAPRPGTAPLPAGAPAPQPSTPPALPQAQPITAGGVRPQLPPAPSITPVGSTFLPGGVELPNNGPPPTPQGMATELGKLEKKLEIALAPEGPLSLLELLNKVIDQVENIEFLIERLFPPGPYTFEGGAYQLQPVCDRDSEGNLIEPLEAPWAGGQGEFVELRQRLDALAQLIQHHKTLKQPTCGGRGNGPHSNVTVHFESD